MENSGVKCDVSECMHNKGSMKCDLSEIMVTHQNTMGNGCAVDTPHFCKSYEKK